MKPWKEYLTKRNIIIGSIILGVLIVSVVFFFVFRGSEVCKPGSIEVDGSCVQCEAGTHTGSNLCLSGTW